jgi:hypothetical protein
MFNRFRRIRSEFGRLILLRVILMIAGLVAMILLDYFAFSSYRAGLIIVSGALLGFLFRGKIPEGIEYYQKLRRASLFIYALILALSKPLGFSYSAQVAIIALTTIIIFNLQFWSLSDSSIVNMEGKTGQ